MSNSKKRTPKQVAQEGEQQRLLRKAEMDRLRARSTVSELRAKVRVLEAEVERVQDSTDLWESLKVTSAEEVHKIRAGSRSNTKPETVSVALASDWHVEERVRPETVHGWNEYTLEIAEERMDRYWRNVVKRVKKHSRDCDISHHIQWLGGDFITGDIHDDAECQLSPQMAVDWLEPRIYAGLRKLRSDLDCERITVVATAGNHGRDGKQKRVATDWSHNKEWLLLHWLRRRIERERAEGGWDGVECICEPAHITYLDIGDYTIRFHHGDSFRYQGGIGGFTVGLNKAVLQMDQSPLRADMDVIGHWHNFQATASAVVNGSLIGWSPYGEKIVKAMYEPPQQALFLVDLERKQRTVVEPIHVVPAEHGP